MSTLSNVQKHSVLVADTAMLDDIEHIQDATTNPSLVYAAVISGKYNDLVSEAVKSAKALGGDEEAVMSEIIDQLLFRFGSQIVGMVPGVVSIEVDPHLSFDKEASMKRARHIVAMFEKGGINRKRLLIKLASTWEGIKAAEELEKEGISCNLTLIFSIAQAIACAEAKVTLISPFVGRITDWYSVRNGNCTFKPEEDPGVIAVRKIFNYFKKYDFKTIVMGASFRNMGQVTALAGCDKLTVPPKILKEMKDSKESIDKVMKYTGTVETQKPDHMTETQFRWELNEDEMATEKLSDGIRKFNADWKKLRAFIKDNLIK